MAAGGGGGAADNGEGSPRERKWAGVASDGALCLLYIVLNSALNATNRLAFGPTGFVFPLTLTAVHMLFNSLLLMPAMLRSPYRQELPRVFGKNWSALCAIGTINVAQIALNNSSLVHLELSMNQVVRATLPIFIAVLQVIQACPPPVRHMPLLVIISLGVHLVVHNADATNGEWWGVFLVTASVALQALQMCFAGRLLSAKLDPLQLIFCTSPFGLAAVAAPAVVMEGVRFADFSSQRPAAAFQVIVGSSLMAVIYNVVLYQTINRLGASGSAVLGNVKVVLLVGLAGLQLGEMGAWSTVQFLGATLTFAGSAAYSGARLVGHGDAQFGRKAPPATQCVNRALGALCLLGLLGFGLRLLPLDAPRGGGPQPPKAGVDPCRDLEVDRALGQPKAPETIGERVLVTGGSGFIGSHLVEHLLDLGYVVHVFDSLETGNLLFLDLRHPRLHFFYGDILDAQALRRAMRGVRGVFHLAAASKVLPSLKDPAMGTFNIERNAVGTSRVLEVANETGLVRKVVYAASSTYYGNQPVPFAETDPFMPTSPYAASKYMGELAMATNDVLYNLHTLSLRFFMVYGPRNPSEGAYAIVTGKFLRRMRDGLPLIIEGSGKNFRDFVHVKDIARALILGYQSGVHGTVVNVGTGRVHSVQEVADLVSRDQQHVAPRRNDLLGTMADTCRAKRLLHFQAEYDFVATMRKMIAEALSGRGEHLAAPWTEPRVVEALERRLPGWASLPGAAERSSRIRRALGANPSFLDELLRAVG